MLEKTLESPLDSKEIKPVNPKGNQFWIFTGRTDAEVEAMVLWPCDATSWLIGKDPHAGKDWEQKVKGATEDDMVEWHHWLYEHEFEQTLGDSEGQGSLGNTVHRVWKSWTQLSDWTTTDWACDETFKCLNIYVYYQLHMLHILLRNSSILHWFYFQGNLKRLTADF